MLIGCENKGIVIPALKNSMSAVVYSISPINYWVIFYRLLNRVIECVMVKTAEMKTGRWLQAFMYE